MNEIGVTSEWYLGLSLALFIIGAAGVLLRRNILVVLMSIELMLNGANLALITFSRIHQSAHGQALAFMIVALAAAEAAVGLAIVVAVLRTRQSTDVDEVDLMKH